MNRVKSFQPFLIKTGSRIRYLELKVLLARTVESIKKPRLNTGASLYLHILACHLSVHEYGASSMMPSDVLLALGSKSRAGLPAVCFFTAKALLGFVFCFFPHFLRNVLDKRGQRGGRRAWRRHSHHQRRGQPRTHGRKERILHLDCRGTCATLSPPFRSLYISLLSLIPLFPGFFLPFFPRPQLPLRPASEEPAGGPQRGSPSVSLLLPLLSFAFRPSLSLAAGALLSHFHMWHKRLEVCISASYMLPTPNYRAPKTQHISYLTSIRCLKIQTPLNFCQSLHVLSVSRGVNCSVGGQSEVISLLSSVILLCIALELKKKKKKQFIWMKILSLIHAYHAGKGTFRWSASPSPTSLPSKWACN